jgi:hypothetical protein
MVLCCNFFLEFHPLSFLKCLTNFNTLKSLRFEGSIFLRLQINGWGDTHSVASGSCSRASICWLLVDHPSADLVVFQRFNIFKTFKSRTMNKVESKVVDTLYLCSSSFVVIEHDFVEREFLCMVLNTSVRFNFINVNTFIPTLLFWLKTNGTQLWMKWAQRAPSLNPLQP